MYIIYDQNHPLVDYHAYVSLSNLLQTNHSMDQYCVMNYILCMHLLFLFASLLYVTSWATTSIVCTSDFGYSVVYMICWERHKGFKFTALIMQTILYHLCKSDIPVCFPTDFIIHWMTKIGGANYAGFHLSITYFY